MAQSPPTEVSTRHGQWFTATPWTVVFAARDLDSPEAAAAMQRLAQTYWPPLYNFIRRDGHDPEDAKDLTQQFFQRLMEKEYLHRLHHRDGKFRTFLLTLLKHFLSDERDKANAQKRGGDQVAVFLDALSEEERYRVEPASAASAEHLFDRRWAQTVLERAVARLRQEHVEHGKEALYAALKDFQAERDEPTPAYADLAARLEMSVGAVAAAIRRFRLRYREILREEVAQTVAHPADLANEIRYLIAVLSR